MLRSEMQHTHDELIERMADSEKRLLQAFYSFAEIESDESLRNRAGVGLAERAAGDNSNPG